MLLVNIKVLKLSRTRIKDIEQIKELKNLEDLNLSERKDILDFSSLKNFINLKRLNLCKTKITDISPIKTLIKVEELNLEKDYDFLKDNKSLEFYQLSNLIKLQDLNIRYANISDIKPLKVLIKLKELDISCIT